MWLFTVTLHRGTLDNNGTIIQVKIVNNTWLFIIINTLK